MVVGVVGVEGNGFLSQLGSLQGVASFAVKHGEFNPRFVEFFVEFDGLLKGTHGLGVALERLQADPFAVECVAVSLAFGHGLVVVVDGLNPVLLVLVNASEVKEGSAEFFVDRRREPKAALGLLELPLAKLGHSQVVPGRF